MNSRLDEMQAAVLRARLPHLGPRTERRRALASRYRALLKDVRGVDVPAERDPGHVYHLFVVRVGEVRGVPHQPGDGDRTALRASLASDGIETLIHYPVPIPRQPALAGAAPDACPIASRVCEEVLSLPLHPALGDADVDTVAEAVKRSLAALPGRT